MNKNIPDKITNYNVYKSGTKLIGMGEEMPIPELSSKTSTLTGAGILGDIETATLGHFDSMELEIPFRMPMDDYFSIFTPDEAVDLTVRGAIQTMKGDGTLKQVGARMVVRGGLKGASFGKFKIGEAAESSVKVEVTYFLLEIDGVKKLELDKLNSIFIVNGKDVLEKVRSLC